SVPSAAITPSSTRTSIVASMPCAGSSTRAPRTTRLSFGAILACNISGNLDRVADRHRHRGADEQVVEDGHACDETGAHLRRNQRVGRVGHPGVDLDTAVHGSGVHHFLSRP